jgi:hypothetical protein
MQMVWGPIVFGLLDLLDGSLSGGLGNSAIEHGANMGLHCIAQRFEVVPAFQARNYSAGTRFIGPFQDRSRHRYKIRVLQK